jgi:hypothetical protein
MDKKSQHVGNHGGAYTDLDGMSKQFTYIDHDKKSKISFNIGGKDFDKEKFFKDSADEILALPAVNAVRNTMGLYEEFILRDQKDGKIKWNESRVREVCSTYKSFFDIGRSLWLITWRTTVREAYWFVDISHEEILAGKWKEWV